jgi:flagellar motility protein MotE (MotC chaperone)
VLKLIAFAVVMASPPGAHDPTPPTPPAGPTAPKEPEAPAANRKSEGAKPAEGKGTEAKTDKKDASKVEAGKAEAGKAEAGKAEAPKGDAHGDVHASEKPAPKKGPASKPSRVTAPAPPSLTGSALRQELKQNGGAEERAAGAPTSERARLEQMAAEITKAREALKQDTARLQEMLRGGGDGRMPIGDGMDAGASLGGAAASKEAMKEQILTVSKAMKGMKPEQAAAIISRLDRVLASEILRRMKPADAGAVMASVKPELAAELATAIATRKSMVDIDPKGAKK